MCFICMKTIKLYSLSRQILISLSILFIFFLLSSCSKKISFNTSTVVPAAQGVVKINKDDNKNHTIDIKIKNLAEPDRLKPAKSVYVVWMVTKENGVKNIGQLVSSRGLFSSLLEATLKTVTPFVPTRIFITAEENSDITVPGSEVILSTRSF
ncbi:hypothetical protein SAMN05421813_10454 [Daejeonella rubra]|uniref:Uncharacterized protein n=2 Tax=Daejeonella rubra TaxID=990371 RepID=A0A1G9PAM1_9SPHI|nr:hypothetical protein SAMN05421813_10454 [Daejeonella rubra]